MSRNQRGSKLVFVGGSPRSGTTLVQNMLGSHPDVIAGPEFLHLPDIVNVRNTLQRSIKRGWIDKYCSAEEVDDAVRALIDNLVLSLRHRSGRRLLSEKTPENVLVFSQLMELYPGARCVHVVRDPRAVVASMLQVGVRADRRGIQRAWYTSDIVSATQQATRWLRAGITAAKAYPNNIFTLVYERLVSNPEQETRKLCDFLELDWSERMLYPASGKHLGEEAITKNSGEVWYTTETYYRNPVKDEVDKWTTQLSTLQQAMVNRSLRELDGLDALGYQIPDRQQSMLLGLLARVLVRIGRSGTLKQFGFRLPAFVRTVS
jgi:protein-tyrosine sulfotransferase